MEREIGASCLKKQVKQPDGTMKTERLFLDELDPEAGRDLKEITPDCGNFCDIEFTQIMDKNVDKIMNGELSLKDLKALREEQKRRREEEKAKKKKEKATSQ